MTKASGTMILAALALAGAGCGATDTEPSAPTDTETKAASEAQVVHASLRFGDEHVLQFVEFKPGLLGVVETGRNVVDVPKVTPELGKLAWVDLYRRFAGASATISKGMEAAQLRAAAREVAPMSVAPPEADLVKVTAGDGPHFYNSSEQTWFLNTFCNGARNCIQGWDWTKMTSQSKIGHASAYAMVGSEGTVNASFAQYYWDCFWSLFTGTVCNWLQFDKVVVVPGHWVNRTESGGSHYIMWNLTGAGANTQVSSAANY
jgi:hypothetical protein